MLQEVCTEVYAVVVAVGSAHSHHSPQVIGRESVFWGEKLNYFALKCARRQGTHLAEWVSGIVDEEIFHLVGGVPLVEVGEVGNLVAGVAECARTLLVALFGPLVELVKSRFHRRLCPRGGAEKSEHRSCHCQSCICSFHFGRVLLLAV